MFLRKKKEKAKEIIPPPENQNDFVVTEEIFPDGPEVSAGVDAVVEQTADPAAEAPVPVDAAAVGAPYISAGMSSVIGARAVQQDSARIDDVATYRERGMYLAVMCDGMGGMSGGEVASNLCVTKLFDAYHSSEIGDKAPAFFRYIIDVLDKEVYNLVDEKGDPIRSGSTITAIIIEGRNLFWLSVGDSRIYLKRGDEMVQITVDYNYGYLLEEKVKKGLITREQADSDPQKEALISYLGIGGVNYFDINSHPVELIDGDTILLCSDGLYRALSESDIKTIMNDFAYDDAITAEALTCAALSMEKKNQDNTTAVIVRYHAS